MDRPSLLAALASGLFIVTIGGGCGSQPSAPPVERHESAVEHHALSQSQRQAPAPVKRREPSPAEQIAKAPTAHDASEIQYSPAVEPEYPPRASPDSDHSAGSAPVEIRQSPAGSSPFVRGGPSPAGTTLAGDSPTTDSAPVSAAIVRGHFARHFLYETWYPHVRDIDVSNRFASIVAWHLNGSGAPGLARRICAAALSLRRLRGASVRFRFSSVNCSSAPSPER